MKTSRFDIFMLSIFVLGVVSTGSAATNTGSILGKVVDDTGSPVSGALVSLESETSGPQPASSDSAGTFYFSKLTPGTYTAIFAAEGFEVVRKADIQVEANVQLPLEITLRPSVASGAGATNQPDSTPEGAQAPSSESGEEPPEAPIPEADSPESPPADLSPDAREEDGASDDDREVVPPRSTDSSDAGASAEMPIGADATFPADWKIIADPTDSVRVTVPPDWQLGKDFFLGIADAKKPEEEEGGKVHPGTSMKEVWGTEEPSEDHPYQLRRSLLWKDHFYSVWVIKMGSEFTKDEEALFDRVAFSLQYRIRPSNQGGSQ